MNIKANKTMRVLVAAVIAGLGAIACSAVTVLPADAAEPAASTPSVQPAGSLPDCTTGWTKDDNSIDLAIDNNTGQELTLNPGMTNHNNNGTGAHWAKQAPSELAPGQCAEVTAYDSDDAAVDNLTINVMYQLPDGDYVPFTVETGANSDNIHVNHTVYQAEPVPSALWGPLGGITWTGAADNAHSITEPAVGSGKWNVSVQLVAN